MGPAPIVLGIAAVAGLVALMVKGGTASPATSQPVPSGSAPDGQLAHLANPTQTLATAASGRKYHVWMYPQIPGTGVYTIAQLVGTTAWIAFMHVSGTTTNVPIKTNVLPDASQGNEAERQRITSQMLEDWNMQPKA